MRHLRPFRALIAVAILGAACSSSPAANSGGNQSQAAQESQAGGASQPAASTGGGGGGGGSGANGSMVYEITGDYEASGELPFIPQAATWVEQAGGWAAIFGQSDGTGAIIQINTQAAEGTPGQIWNFGDGTVLVVATSDPGSGAGCTFTLTKNDSSGTEGQVECTTAPMTNVESGASGKVQVSARWEGRR